MNAGVIVAAISGLVSVVVAIVAQRGARDAQRITADTQRRQGEAENLAAREKSEREEQAVRAQVEAHAYARARESYERIVKDLEAQLTRNQVTVERVQQQIDVVLARLATEQDVSNSLRNQIRSLQDRIAELQRENDRFKTTIAEMERVTSNLETALRQAGAPLPAPGNPIS